MASHWTLMYSPVEKIRLQNINHKADIYSLGLIFAEILFGRHPYYDESSWRNYRDQSRHKHEEKEKIW